MSIETKGKPLLKKNVRSYYFKLLLYPDCNEHKSFMELIDKIFPERWFGILHDKDIWLENDTPDDNNNDANDDMQVEHVVGELKKAHWHIIVKMSHQYTVSSAGTFFETFGIKSYYVSVCDPYSFALYLDHRLQKDKYQYSPKDIIGNKVLYDTFVSGDNARFEEFLEACYLIKEKGLSFIDAVSYINSLGLYDVLKSAHINTYILKSCVKEKF